VRFDDRRVVADAGVALAATLAGRLGIEALVDEAVDLGDRAGAANPGAKVMTLISAMALGADSIDDCDLLRSARTGAVLGHRVVAPSTLGTFLRAFTFGHVRQLDRVLDRTLERAWAAGAGPGDGRLVVDVDSFVGEVHGYAKQGAAFGYTRQRDYHPIVASRADSGEVLHLRLRKGSANTLRGAQRFVDELIARVERAGASGPKLLRADSGFWSKKIFARLQGAGWDYSIGVRLQPHVRAAIEQIPEHAWRPLVDYPATSEAQIAETTLGDQRLVARRVRTLDAQGHAATDLGALPVRHQPRRCAGDRRGRAPPARRRRAAHPRSQRPSACALPLGPVLRQRRLDGDRRARPQPAALDQPARTPRPDPPRRPHPAPPVASAARPPDPQRPPLDAAPAHPLALAATLHRSPHPHPSAPRRLTARPSPTVTLTAFRRPRPNRPAHSTRPPHIGTGTQVTGAHATSTPTRPPPVRHRAGAPHQAHV
jgi:hypothetical protein